MTDTDESLLKAFAGNRDEKAFRALADRYLGLVFHTAMRRSKHRQLAEEISQNILCALAKKAAALARNPDRLAAWLHRATLFESSNAMSAETSQQRRQLLQVPAETPLEDSAWTDALPHLDAAIDKLPDADRRVVLLHFFENRSFPGIARSLGKSTVAVQKQSQRALEKLARLLRAKGVTLTATALATGLSAEFAKAAPLTFAQSAATAVLTGSATYSTTALTLMFAAKSKALVPLVVLLCALPLALQQVAISKVRSQNDELRKQIFLADNSGSKSTTLHGLAATTGTRISSNLDIMVLAEEQYEARRAGGLKQIVFTEKLAALDPDILVRLIGEAAAIRIQRDKKSGILDALISSLAENDVRLAVTEAVAAFPAGPEFPLLVTQVASHFGAWAAADPAAALAWYQEQEQSEKFNPASSPGFPDPIKPFKAPLIRALVGTHNAQALAILDSVPGEERESLLSEALWDSWSRANTEKSRIAIKFMPLIRAAFPIDQQDQALRAVGRSLAWDDDGGLEEASRFFSQADLTSEEKTSIARAITESTPGTGRYPPDPKRNARIDAEMSQWLRDVMPNRADEFLQGARDKAAAGRAKEAEYIIKCLQESTELTDNKLSSDLRNYDFKSHLPEALELAGKIKDPAMRASTIEFLNKP
jgi:RNA polymerase sigma-70 factor (ECF subfamily)